MDLKKFGDGQLERVQSVCVCVWEWDGVICLMAYYVRSKTIQGTGTVG